MANSWPAQLQGRHGTLLEKRNNFSTLNLNHTRRHQLGSGELWLSYSQKNSVVPLKGLSLLPLPILLSSARALLLQKTMRSTYAPLPPSLPLLPSMSPSLTVGLTLATTIPHPDLPGCLCSTDSQRHTHKTVGTGQKASRRVTSLAITTLLRSVPRLPLKR